jgi:hypothetical protein
VGAGQEAVSRLDAVATLAEQIRDGADRTAAGQAEKLLLRAADLREDFAELTLKRSLPTAERMVGTEGVAEIRRMLDERGLDPDIY